MNLPNPNHKTKLIALGGVYSSSKLNPSVKKTLKKKLSQPLQSETWFACPIKEFKLGSQRALNNNWLVEC